MSNLKNEILILAVLKASKLFMERQMNLPDDLLLATNAEQAEMSELRHLWQEALEDYNQFFYDEIN